MESSKVSESEDDHERDLSRDRSNENVDSTSSKDSQHDVGDSSVASGKDQPATEIEDPVVIEEDRATPFSTNLQRRRQSPRRASSDLLEFSRTRRETSKYRRGNANIENEYSGDQVDLSEESAGVFRNGARRRRQPSRRTSRFFSQSPRRQRRESSQDDWSGVYVEEIDSADNPTSSPTRQTRRRQRSRRASRILSESPRRRGTRVYVESDFENELSNDDSKPAIRFTDVLGRVYPIPWRFAKTWKKTKPLIEEPLRSNHTFRTQILQGQYELIGPDNIHILPEVWDFVVEPGWEVSMKLFSDSTSRIMLEGNVTSSGSGNRADRPQVTSNAADTTPARGIGPPGPENARPLDEERANRRPPLPFQRENKRKSSGYVPTYIKINKAHLEEETLRYYRLPYQVDKADPNHFIILRELSEDETDLLFEHTRRLRSREKSDPGLDSETESLTTRVRNNVKTSAGILFFEDDPHTPLNILISISDNDTSNNMAFQESKYNSNSTSSVQVFAAKRYADVYGSIAVDLTGRSMQHVDFGTTSEGGPTHFMWIHNQCPYNDFHDYERFLMSVGSHHKAYMPLIHSLLTNLRAMARRSGSVDAILANDTVLRAEGQDHNNPDKRDIHATFCVYPYFDTGPLSLSTKPGLENLIHSRYRGEDTRLADVKQSIAPHPANLSKHVIVLSQLWTVWLGSEVVVTYCPGTMDDLCGVTITRSEPEQAAQGPHIVKVTDPRQRTYFFSMSHCRTFYELREIINEAFSKEERYTRSKWDIFFDDDREATAESWLLAQERGQSLILSLFIRLRFPSDSRKDKDQVDIVPRTSISRDRRIRDRSEQFGAGPNIEGKPDISGASQSKLAQSENIRDNKNATRGQQQLQFIPRPLPDHRIHGAIKDNPSEAKDITDSAIESLSLQRGMVAALKSVAMRVPPFLTWTGEEDISALKHLLTDINERFQHSPLFKKLEEKKLDEISKVANETPQDSEHNAQQPPTKVDSNINASDSTETLTDPAKQTTMTAKYQASVRAILHEEMYEISTALFELFVPESIDHPLTRKYWGALDTILSALRKLSPKDTSDDTARHASDDKEADIWLIRDLKDCLPPSELANISRPSHPFEDCNACSLETKYRLLPNALRHLTNVHFSGPGVMIPPDEHMMHWLRTKRQVELQSWRKQQVKITWSTFETLVKAYETTKAIGQSVSSKNGQHPGYSLPESAKEAFEKIVRLMSVTARLLISLNKQYGFWSLDKMPLLYEERIDTSDFVFKADDRLDKVANDLYFSLQQIREDMIGMAAKSMVNKVSSYSAVGPEYTMIAAMKNLNSQELLPGIDIETFYQDTLSKLQFEVYQRPRRTLLKSIMQLHQESSVIQDVLSQQDVVLQKLKLLLNPTAFRDPTSLRESMYELEEDALDNLLRQCQQRNDSFESRDKRSMDITNQLRQELEILDADHGKAIYIFTTITVVFLPLSFVSSFFGMNTVDVRNTSSSQWLYWAISIPLTIVVIAVALLIAYKSEELRGVVNDMQDRVRGSKHRLVVPEQEVQKMITEKLEGRPQRHWLKRRPRRVNTDDGWMSAI